MIRLVRFSTDIVPIFRNNCAIPGCHTGAAPAQFLDLSPLRAYVELVNILSSECRSHNLVTPGNPSASYLSFKVEGAGPCFQGVQMPYLKPPLPPIQRELIRAWIAQGALNN